MRIFYIGLLSFGALLPANAAAVAAFVPANDTLAARLVLTEAEQELELTMARYETAYRAILSRPLRGRAGSRKNIQDRLQRTQSLQRLERELTISVAKIRYKKGLEVIKLLHEKVLSLDHHFSSLETFQSINRITNPNSYPEFVKFKESLAKQSDNRSAPLLQSPVVSNNLYLSAIGSLVSLVDNRRSKSAVPDEGVECILDFTLTTYNSLKTVYYETEFIQNSVEDLKIDVTELFEQYVATVDYNVPLKKCRKEDDWESLYKLIDEHFERLEGLAGEDGNPRKLYRMESNVNFSIDQLTNFLALYETTVLQARKYYTKFNKILDSYAPAEGCKKYLPREYTELKEDIDDSVKKFELSYNVAELKGSKLKEVLYGNAY